MYSFVLVIYSLLTIQNAWSQPKYYYMDDSDQQCNILIPYVVGPNINKTAIVASWNPHLKERKADTSSCVIHLKSFHLKDKVGKLRVEFFKNILHLQESLYFACDPLDPLGRTHFSIHDGSQTSSKIMRQYTCGSRVDLVKYPSVLTTSGEHLTLQLTKGNRFDQRYHFRLKVSAIYENDEGLNGLALGAIIGIVIAVLLIVAVIGLTVFCTVRAFNVSCASGRLSKFGTSTSSTQNIPGAMSGDYYAGQENQGFMDNSPTRVSVGITVLDAPPQMNGSAYGGARPKIHQDNGHISNTNVSSYDRSHSRLEVQTAGYDKGIDIMEESPRTRRHYGRHVEEDFKEDNLEDSKPKHARSSSSIEVEVEINPNNTKDVQSQYKNPEKLQPGPSHYTSNYDHTKTNDRHNFKSKHPTLGPASSWERSDSYFVATHVETDKPKWQPEPSQSDDRLFAENGDADSGISSRSNSDRFLKTCPDTIEEAGAGERRWQSRKSGIKLGNNVRDTSV